MSAFSFGLLLSQALAPWAAFVACAPEPGVAVVTVKADARIGPVSPWCDQDRDSDHAEGRRVWCARLRAEDGEEPYAGPAVWTPGTEKTMEWLVVLAEGEEDEDEPDDDDEAMPGQWLGVRLTPVPDPLAAHIGPQGLMVANIVKDSPADRAGLRQYDVIVALGDRKTNDMEDLLEVLEEAQPGKPISIWVIREGKKQRMQIAPARRPAGMEFTYKYEEPAEDLEDLLDRSLRLRGRRLMFGPGGKWTIEDLGPLHDLPDVLRELEKWNTFSFDLDEDDFERHFPEPGPGFFWFFDDDEDFGERRIEVRVEVEDDGTVTTVQRDADGHITVTRVRPDGKKSTVEYEDEETFRREDPEGYRLYRQYSGDDEDRFIWRQLDPRQLDELRKQFQVDVEVKLRKALEEAREAARRAREQAEKAREQAEKSLEKTREKVERLIKVRRRGRDGDVTESICTMSIEIDEEGHITVTTRKDGLRKTYEFDDRETFQREEPELYRKFKSMLE